LSLPLVVEVGGGEERAAAERSAEGIENKGTVAIAISFLSILPLVVLRQDFPA
jgi:hypothetical protein